MIFEHVLISRLGFAVTASYHIIFPSLIIGLAFFLSALEIAWFRTGREIYRRHYRFWLKFFVTAFVVGVVTGVGLSFQLDTHFGNFYRTTIDVLVPIRRVELINTIVLEAGALGIMLWGWNRVGKRLHLAATLMMNVGVVIAGVCILARNSWMQTPDGYLLENGHLVLDNWLAAVISPSFPYRFLHMITAALLSTGFFVLGVSAWYLFKKRHVEFARLSLRVSVLTIAILAPAQLVIGHMHGLNSKEHQPMKVAAMEGLWETSKGAPLVLFGVPDQERQTNHWALEVPKLGSLVLTHQLDSTVKGLEEFPSEDWPKISIVFFSFRIMVGLGLLMIVVGTLGCVLLLRQRAYNSRWFLRICLIMTPSGLIATIAGWMVTEVGRQPWTIYGLVRTSDVVRDITAAEVLHSLMLMGFVYGMTCVAVVYIVRRTLSRGPETAGSDTRGEALSAALPHRLS
jgi:cytochrome d ubiquinol oxidase subunit I